MPDHFDWHFGLAVFDRGYICEIVVLLRFVIVQPTDYLTDARARDENRCLTPTNRGAQDRVSKLLLERCGRWIRVAAAVRDILRSGWRWRVGERAAHRHYLKRFDWSGHGVERV